MQLGTLTFRPIKEHDNLVATVVSEYAFKQGVDDKLFVSKIDANLADTASFCAEYEVGLDISTNCLVIEARRGDRTWYAACLVLAPDMADINGVVRRALDARKTSFAPKEITLAMTQMEYGGITPVGLPDDWTILVDESILAHDVVVVGGGIRGSKIAVKTAIFSKLPNAKVMDLKK